MINDSDGHSDDSIVVNIMMSIVMNGDIGVSA